MNRKWMVIGILAAVLLPGFLFGMHSGSQALFAGRSDTIVDVIGAAGKGALVRFETPFFSDREITAALRDAAKRGADVLVRTSSRARAALGSAKKAGVEVKVVKDEHTKRCLVSLPPSENFGNLTPLASRKREREKPEDGPETATAIFVGSDNLSSLSKHHKEVMISTMNNQDLFDQHFALFGTPKRPPTKKRVGLTPLKPVVLSSVDYEMNQSKADRIKTLISGLSASDSLDITSMTFDSGEIVSAIEELYTKRTGTRPKIRCILDRAALKHKDLLDRMHKAGVAIYIYNEDAQKKIWDRFPTIQHTKTITRESDGKHLTIVSTGNLTRNSDEHDFNLDEYHPNDAALFKQIRAYNDALVGECSTYEPKP